MALSKLAGFELSGSVIVHPANTQDNSNLEEFSETEKEQLIHHTGIKFRKIVEANTQIIDYFEHGINHLLDQLKWDVSEIDVLICVTQNIQTSIPSLSCKLHGELNFSQNTLCFDINSGCSGFVYGVHNAMSILQSLMKQHAKAILCCGDFSSQLINQNDKSTIPVFSDAISVTGLTSNQNELASFFNLETDGSGRKAIYVENQFMHLNGIDVFNYSLKLVPNHLKALLNFAEIENLAQEVFVFHQANKLINDALVKRLSLNPEKVPSTLYEYGNTASASIPLSLGIFSRSEPISKVVLCGFGVGFSLASAVVHLSPNFSFSIVEL
ncbi:MAG: ketoacyl-ACP synthase III [bacterium]|nr:ketoacyl-ACP synthase III [bacterium]